MKVLKKLSTIYKRERVANPEKFKAQRDEFLDCIVKSKPRMNVRVTITQKPF